MSNPPLTITIHLACSLDGIIAKANNDIAWMETSSLYEKGTDLHPEQIAAFLSSIDCYVMGAKTYEHAMALSASYGWAYGNTRVIVISSRDLPKVNEKVSFFSGELTALVNQLKAYSFKNVWVVGGALLAQAFLREKLADQLRLSILPIVLGEGLTLFQNVPEQALQLRELRAGKNGIVDICYDILK